MLFLLLAGGVMWIPVASLWLGDPPGFLRDLGFASGAPGTVMAWSLGLAVAVAYSAFAVRRIPLVRQHWRALSLAKFVALLAAVSAAIVEEAFFRRLVMDALMYAGWPVALQVLGSGGVFGAAHGTWALATGRPHVGLRAMVATGILGTALAFVYALGGRSLAPVIVAHFIVTATIQPGIMIAAFEGRMREGTFGKRTRRATRQVE